MLREQLQGMREQREELQRSKDRLEEQLRLRVPREQPEARDESLRLSAGLDRSLGKAQRELAEARTRIRDLRAQVSVLELRSAPSAGSSPELQRELERLRIGPSLEEQVRGNPRGGHCALLPPSNLSPFPADRAAEGAGAPASPPWDLGMSRDTCRDRG
ncbi:rootletin-like [Empidonax traillii]|uniref:rootletin-like n=1 Tax=Empidonax traillii TaxID=164674 RepID=UPI000FFD055E|nr:rootletin-like [Empidonax traillii]